MSITLATNCWENDWEYLLKKGYLERLVENCNYSFDKRVLCIGNVSNLDKVMEHVLRKIEEGIIDNYIITQNISEEVLEFFSVEMDSFKGGFNYSIAPLSVIYRCETDLLLYFTGDAHIKNDGGVWIKRASDLLMKDNSIFVANPLWNDNSDEAKEESFDETNEDFIGYGFSDQCFLIRTEDFRKPIYNEWNIASERYPKYGGEPFEKRVDSYMRNHQLYRATSKSTSYIHQNYPYKKKSFFKKLFRF